MNHQNVVELVEQALHSEPRCTACGSPTHPVVRDSGLSLECAAPDRPTSFLRRLVSFDGGYAHTRRHLIDAEAIEPAA